MLFFDEISEEDRIRANQEAIEQLKRLDSDVIANNNRLFGKAVEVIKSMSDEQIDAIYKQADIETEKAFEQLAMNRAKLAMEIDSNTSKVLKNNNIHNLNDLFGFLPTEDELDEEDENEDAKDGK